MLLELPHSGQWNSGYTKLAPQGPEDAGVRGGIPEEAMPMQKEGGTGTKIPKVGLQHAQLTHSTGQSKGRLDWVSSLGGRWSEHLGASTK